MQSQSIYFQKFLGGMPQDPPSISMNNTYNHLASYTIRPHFNYVLWSKFLDPLVCFQEDYTTLPPQYPVIPHFDPPWLKS